MNLLGKYPECFLDVPGYTDVILFHWQDTFKPKRSHAYHVPQILKPKVRQIEEMLRDDIIRHARSPTASPLEYVSQGKEGCDD